MWLIGYADVVRHPIPMSWNTTLPGALVRGCFEKFFRVLEHCDQLPQFRGVQLAHPVFGPVDRHVAENAPVRGLPTTDGHLDRSHAPTLAVEVAKPLPGAVLLPAADEGRPRWFHDVTDQHPFSQVRLRIFPGDRQQQGLVAPVPALQLLQVLDLLAGQFRGDVTPPAGLIVAVHLSPWRSSV